MKNRYIELERFIAACMVLCFHLGISKGGWIFVEFFFMLTGCFAMRHIEKKAQNQEKNWWYPLQYTGRKYVKLLPYTGISIFLMWLMVAICNKLSFKELLKWILWLPSEMGLLAGTGMQSAGMQIAENLVSPRLLNTDLWYICSMLCAMPFVVAILMWAKKSKPFFVTLIPLLIYGILIMKDGTITGWHDDRWCFVFLNLRAGAGLLLGAGAYYFSEWWCKRRYTSLGKWLLTIIEVITFLFVAIVSCCTNLKFDALQVILLFLSISLTNSGVTHTTKIKFSGLEFLGAISLPIYCIQRPVIYGWQILHLENKVIPFIGSIVFGIVIYFMFTWIGQYCKRYKEKIKKMLVI